MGHLSQLIPKLEYTILSGRGSENVELHNTAFSYWKNFWTNVFKELGSESVRPLC